MNLTFDAFTLSRTVAVGDRRGFTETLALLLLLLGGDTGATLQLLLLQLHDPLAGQGVGRGAPGTRISYYLNFSTLIGQICPDTGLSLVGILCHKDTVHGTHKA